MKAWMRLVLACALVAPQVAGAATPDAVDQQPESSMLVTGTIDIATDGSVSGHRLDQPGKIPGGVVALVAGSLPEWRFEPIRVEGKAVPARVTMGLRIRARRNAGGGYEVDIRSASFGADAVNMDRDVDDATRRNERSLRLVSNRRPDFPRGLAQAGVTGTVYLVLRVAPDGVVADAFDEKVDLRVTGSVADQAAWRDRFARSALEAGRKWRLQVGPALEFGDDGFAYVRVPIDYALPGIARAGYGEWDTYLPGPVRRAPWRMADDGASFSPDAMVAGDMQPAGSGPKLLTPLGEG